LGFNLYVPFFGGGEIMLKYHYDLNPVDPPVDVIINGLMVYDGPLSTFQPADFNLRSIVTRGPTSCDSDFEPSRFNASPADGADVGEFFSDWESGAACADVNVDGADVAHFFDRWAAGGC